jgi:enamine deaminase RidA (YjgF/YER057c/UK114 family)
MKSSVLVLIAALCAAPFQAMAQGAVKTLSPSGAIKPTGTWSLGTRAGDFVFVAGMRGIDPKTNSEGASLRDAVRLVVYVTDMYRFRPLVNKVQEQLWGAGPYPPRTIIEVHRLNQDDIVEVEGTFYAPRR